MGYLQYQNSNWAPVVPNINGGEMVGTLRGMVGEKGLRKQFVINISREIEKELKGVKLFDDLDDAERVLSFYLAKVKHQEDCLLGLKKWRGTPPPKWLKKILPIEGSFPGLDHWSYGRMKDSKGETLDFLISEPYNAGLEELEKMCEICKKGNVGLLIDGGSTWFPGRTIRIRVIRRKEKEG